LYFRGIVAGCGDTALRSTRTESLGFRWPLLPRTIFQAAYVQRVSTIIVRELEF
jgi:hypothetical protein